MSSFTNNKAVIELINKLQPATPGKGSHLHRFKEKDGQGKSMLSSLVGINIVDYHVDPSVFVEENLTPSQVRELYYEAIMKRKEYTFSGNGQKIFGEPDQDGLCKVRVIYINRQMSYTQNGKVINKNYPWKVRIQNGRGVKEKNAVTGGYTCKEGTFRCEKKAEINLSDGDFFALFDKAVNYINAWEQYYANYFVKQNEKAIKEEEENFRNRKQ